MSKDPTIRCDKWMLAADAELVRMVELTTGQYRRMTKAVSGMLMVHWPKLANASSRNRQDVVDNSQP